MERRALVEAATPPMTELYEALQKSGRLTETIGETKGWRGKVRKGWGFRTWPSPKWDGHDWCYWLDEDGGFYRARIPFRGDSMNYVPVWRLLDVTPLTAKRFVELFLAENLVFKDGRPWLRGMYLEDRLIDFATRRY
jgi:hypothetical protein